MSTATHARSATAVDDIADSLATPPQATTPHEAQSLADGAAGIALLHIERAVATGQWNTTHQWLRSIVRDGVHATIDSSLYRGAPAIAFILRAARTDGGDRYHRASAALDRAVTALAHRRVNDALARIARRELPTMAEYDIISGLTGIGAHLLYSVPDDEALPRVLDYLVQLTQPLQHGGDTRPGWWTAQSPHARISAEFPGGHSNHGLAHGVTGPLALLALARRREIAVDGQTEAIELICAWLDRWRQHDETGAWWPQWVTDEDHRTGRTHQSGPQRPSWCYGTPGIARAQQLAGIALGDRSRQQFAEQAFASCLADADQLDRIRDVSLCHGWAGLLMTAWQTAIDAQTPAISDQLRHITDQLLDGLAVADDLDDGLLEGRAGVALALHAAATGEPPTSGWDACLLIA